MQRARLAAVIGATLLLPLVLTATGGAATRTSEVHTMRNLLRQQGMEARILWLDLRANLKRLDSREKVRSIVQKAKKANINTLIVDVKDYTGYVAYTSDLAPHYSEFPVPPVPADPAYRYPAGYDLLATVVEEGHAAGMQVLANVNVFAEGDTGRRLGPAHSHPDWQATFYTAERVLRAADGATRRIDAVNGTRFADFLVLYTRTGTGYPTNRWGVDVVVGSDNRVLAIHDRLVTGGPAPAIPVGGYILSGHGSAYTWLKQHVRVGDVVDPFAGQVRFVRAAEYSRSFATFVNPLHPEVQAYELGIIAEIARRYDIDGITLDRARYADIFADFSDRSRAAFAQYLASIGKQLNRWPEDVFTIRMELSGDRIVRGPLWGDWIDFRARNIYEFFRQAEATLHSIKPRALFTTYVGSWYRDYWNEGVNWGSQTYLDTPEWAGDNYYKYGYAQLLDFIMTGLYYPQITKEEAVAAGTPDWYSVEGAAEMSLDVVDWGTLVYGSLYLLQYADPAGPHVPGAPYPDPSRYQEAIRMVTAKTHGVMLFDLVYLEPEWYNWWDATAQVFDRPARAPHAVWGMVRQNR